jgi:hypothetical protein
MKPAPRFFLNWFAPPAVATTLLAAGALLFTDTPVSPGLFLIVLGYAYFFAGVPSLMHAAVLECAYRRDWSPRGGGALALSSVNGLCAGIALGLLISGGQSEGSFSSTAGIFALLGALTGALNALLHRCFPRAHDSPGE